MNNQTYTLTGLQEIDKLAAQFCDELLTGKSNRIFAFFGAMGAGKTTFIKAICGHLGATQVTSPTFALVNEYPLESGKLIYHFDFYRINTLEEAYDIGFDEYLYNPDAYCFIEWPEKIESLLPDNHIKVCIEEKNTSAGAGIREIRIC